MPTQCKFLATPTFVLTLWFRKEKMKDTVSSYTAKTEVDKILIEATGNENWNIANSKLQTLADATYEKYVPSIPNIN